jgi:ankyrin repeat protein
VQEEKAFMVGAKERKERDEAIASARGKLDVIVKQIEASKVVLSHRQWDKSVDISALLKRYVQDADVNRIKQQMGHGHIDSTSTDEQAASLNMMKRAYLDCIESYADDAPPDVVDETDNDGIDWRNNSVLNPSAINNNADEFDFARNREETFEILRHMLKHLLHMTKKGGDASAALSDVSVNTIMSDASYTHDSDDDEGERVAASNQQTNLSAAQLLLQQQKQFTGSNSVFGKAVSSGVVTIEGDLIAKLSSSAAGGTLGASGANVSGAALFALKNAFRILKSDVVAQYMCATTNSVEDGVGMRINNRSVQREIIEAFAAKGATPLHVAAELDHYQVIDILVTECGLDICELDADRRNVLHYACSRGQLETVKHIVEKYFSTAEFLVGLSTSHPIDSEDSDGLTPLAVAVIGGHVSIARYLIDGNNNNASIRANRIKQVDASHSASLLHWSVMSGRLPIVQYLHSECGISIDIKCKIDGCTPIFWAAFSSSLLVCKYLVENGCDLRRVDTCLETVTHYAAASGNIDKIMYFTKILGSSILQEKDDSNNRPGDVAGSAVVADYITGAKKGNIAAKNWQK